MTTYPDGSTPTPRLVPKDLLTKIALERQVAQQFETPERCPTPNPPDSDDEVTFVPSSQPLTEVVEVHDEVIVLDHDDEIQPAIRSEPSLAGKGREWCFTWPILQVGKTVLKNMPLEICCSYATERLEEIFTEHCDYLIFGKETGTSGYEHYQGFLVLKKKQRFSYLKKMFPKEVHIEQMAAFSSVEKNIEYCSKEGDVTTFGIPPLSAKDAAASGGKHGKLGGEAEKLRWKTANELAMQGDYDEIDPQIKICHFGNILKIHSYATRDQKILEHPCGHWLYGVPGSGKSWSARHDFNPESLYLKAANKWFDGYNDQDYVLIEDLDPSHAWMANHLKCWMDVYPFSAEIKGGVMQIRPKGIIVTSNYSMETIFGNSQVDVLAIKRRCKVTHFPFRYGATTVSIEDAEPPVPQFNLPESSNVVSSEEEDQLIPNNPVV